MSADLWTQVGGLLARTAAAVHLKRRCAAGPLYSAQLSLSRTGMLHCSLCSCVLSCSIGLCVT